MNGFGVKFVFEEEAVKKDINPNWSNGKHQKSPEIAKIRSSYAEASEDSQNQDSG